MLLPWPGGLSGLCYPLCHSFLTSYGMNELLGLRSLYLAFSLGWVLLGHRSFLLQSSLCLLCGSTDTSAMPPHYLCHVAFWFMLIGPPWACPALSLLLSDHVAQYYYWACSHTFLGFLGLFYSFGHPWPTWFLWPSSAHSNPSFPWISTKSFRLSGPITISFTFKVCWLFYHPHLLIFPLRSFGPFLLTFHFS